MSANLSVVYKSQWDADATDTRDDCGPCSAAMILNFYGENLTTNQVFEKSGAKPDALITIQQMINACAAFGYEASYYTNSTPDKLKEYLDAGIPVVALVHYGAFSSRQDQNFYGGHLFAVVGYREDGYFVNDPDFWGKFRQDGDHHFYTKDDFEKGWGTCSKDENPNNSFLVIRRKAVVVDETVAGNASAFIEVCKKLGVAANKSIALQEIENLQSKVGSYEDMIREKDKLLDETKKQLAALTEELGKVKIENTQLKEDLAKLKTETGQKLTEMQQSVTEKEIIIGSLEGAFHELENTLTREKINYVLRFFQGLVAVAQYFWNTFKKLIGR